MIAKIEKIDLPVIKDPADFDDQSGDALERLIFNHRPLVLLLVALVTLVLGFQATRLQINASFEDMIPQSLDQVPSGEPAMYALEMNRGWFAAHGVSVGATITRLPPASAR